MTWAWLVGWAVLAVVVDLLLVVRLKRLSRTYPEPDTEREDEAA